MMNGYHCLNCGEKLKQPGMNLSGEDIVIVDGIFHSSTIEESISYIHSLYPDGEVIIHEILPGEAHITVMKREEEA